MGYEHKPGQFRKALVTTLRCGNAYLDVLRFQHRLTQIVSKYVLTQSIGTRL